MNRREFVEVSFALIILGLLVAPSVRAVTAPNVVLVLDSSDSMKEILPGWNATKVDVVRNSTQHFVQEIADNGKWNLGIVQFNTAPYLRAPIQPILDRTAAAGVSETLIDRAGGWTNVAAALALATQLLQNSPTTPDQSRIIILVSDGAPTHPMPDPKQAALNVANYAKSQGIVIVSVMIPYSRQLPHDSLFMQQLASRPSLFKFAQTPQELDGWFASLVSADFAHPSSTETLLAPFYWTLTPIDAPPIRPVVPVFIAALLVGIIAAASIKSEPNFDEIRS